MTIAEPTLEVTTPNRATILREIMGEEQFNTLVSDIREAMAEIDQATPEELVGVDPEAVEDARSFLAEIDNAPTHP